MPKLSLIAFLLSMLLLMAAPTSAQSEWVCPPGFEGQTLRVFNWAQYVAEDTVPNFEEACGVTVEYFEYGSNEELLTVLRNDTALYDVAFPSNDFVPVMIQEGLLHELDHDKIPNYGNLMENFTGTIIDPDNQYSVAYQWGTIGIMVDVNYVDEDLKTWDDFLAYEGRVAWPYDSRAFLGTALIKLGFDPNTTNEDEIQAAADYLIENTQSDLYQIAQNTQEQLLYQGEVDAVMAYSGGAILVMQDCDCDDFAYIFPEDVLWVWFDNVVIPANAPNPDLAHVFIDYVLDPQVGADISNYVGYATPNDTALPLIDEAVRANPIIYPDEELIANGIVVQSVGDALQYYTEAWNRVNAAFASN